MNDDTKAGLIVGALAPVIIVLVVLVAVPFTLLESWGVWLLYGWFVQPFGLPDVGYWHVVGLMLLFGLLTHRFIPDRSDKNAKFGKLFGRLFVGGIGTLFVIGIGALAHGWM